MNRSATSTGVLLGCFLLTFSGLFGARPLRADDDTPFRVGFAKVDVTPQKPMPMWGYGARHDALSDGSLDPLYAKALVIEAGDQRLAIVGLDLGRGPTIPMMEKIRSTISEKAGIQHAMLCGSHTHHGPVLELTDRPGFGQGKFDAAVQYAEKLPDLLSQCILEAADNLQDATIGIGKRDIPFNRNRHTKRQPKPTDPMLAVLRFDDNAGKPIAVLVNFAAHPVMTDTDILKFSADYPGFMMNRVAQEMDAECLFIQGASGDLSPNPPAGKRGPREFGEALADEVIEVAKSIQTAQPERPMIQGKVDRYRISTRIDMQNRFILRVFGTAFFPELVRNYFDEWQYGLPVEVNTILLNREIALVSGSGEFFCNHSNRLKQRCYTPHTLFFGYCNGHNLYFPTIEAASEGGYGAGPQVSLVEIGTGELLMNEALKNIYAMLGKFDPKPAMQAKPYETQELESETTGP
jgi:hypothetical protein